MEHRIYLINPRTEDFNLESIPTCLIELYYRIKDLTDDEFMDIAEEQGHVYTLKGFEQAFNNEDISDRWYMRIINK